MSDAHRWAVNLNGADALLGRMAWRSVEECRGLLFAHLRCGHRQRIDVAFPLRLLNAERFEAFICALEDAERPCFCVPYTVEAQREQERIQSERRRRIEELCDPVWAATYAAAWLQTGDAEAASSRADVAVAALHALER